MVNASSWPNVDNRTPLEPAGWWGPAWSEPHRLSLIDLVRTCVLDATIAAALWTLVESGRSLTVAAGPSGAGKTTLLTSLLDALPVSNHRYFVRGLYERFDRLRTHPAGETALLVNEISPHLPIYAWGPVVRSLLEASMDGYQVLATIHARSIEEVVGQLGGYPLRIPSRYIAQLGTVVFLDAWENEQGVHRRVDSVVSLSYDHRQDALAVEPISDRESHSALVTRRAELIRTIAHDATQPGSDEFASAMRDVR